MVAIQIIKKVIAKNLTQKSSKKLEDVVRPLLNVSHVDGAIVEVGVWKGGSAMVLNAARKGMQKDAEYIMNLWEGKDENLHDMPCAKF